MIKDVIRAISYTRFDATTLTNVYQVCVDQLPRPASILKFVSNADSAISISYDGSIDHEIVPAYSEVKLLFQRNYRVESKISMLPKGTPIYVKYTIGAPKGGYLYVISYYQP